MAKNKFGWNLILACSDNNWTVAINSKKKNSYRDDSSAKPPSSSLTLQNKTPLTKGTDESSSKSKSTLNLNLFFFMRMNDMMRPRVTTSRAWSWQTAGHFPCSALSPRLSQLLVVAAADPKFKSPPSHPPTNTIHDVGGMPPSDWTLQLQRKEECPRSPL